MENIKDGTAEFRVTDDRLFSILDLIYPVGRIIISNDSTAPYSDIGFGTWQEVAKGAFIEGADDNHKAGDNIDAGLPNITGTSVVSGYGWYEWDDIKAGAFSTSVRILEKRCDNLKDIQSNSWGDLTLTMDASNSNSIYGKSNTVQPKAYVSHYWLRVK